MIGLSNQAHKDNWTWLQILILSIMEIGFIVFCKTVQEISGLKMIYDGYILKASTAVPFRGPEGVLIWPIMKIDFMVFFKEGNDIYQLFFTSWKHIDPSKSYRKLKVSTYV